MTALSKAIDLTNKTNSKHMNDTTVVLRKETEGNPFGNGMEVATAPMAVATTRAAQEVQAAMVIAKKFPRNESQAFSRIMQACKRKTLAEEATYEYPRGGEKITGPSIRLAEVLSQAWGNMESGIVELEQRNGESDVMAFAWDLETNTRSTKIFQIKHERHTKSGVKKLSDPRDIYETVANQGARRLRACILSVIPGDIVDSAVKECEKTLTTGNSEPLVDRIRKMVTAFAEYQVTVAMIEKWLGHKLEVISEQKFAKLRGIYSSLKDGMSSREDWFDPNANQPTANFGDDIPMGEPAMTNGNGSPDAGKLDIRAEFMKAVNDLGLPHDRVLETLLATVPAAAGSKTLDAALKAIHGKTIKALTQDMVLGKWAVKAADAVGGAGAGNPTDPLGAESPELIDLKKRLTDGGLTINQFLSWGVQGGAFPEVTDLREIPKNVLQLILKDWVRNAAMIGLQPK